MTRAELLKIFPHAKEPFLRANATDGVIGVALADTAVVTPAKRRLRQSQKPTLNDLETRFMNDRLVGGRLFYSQAVRLELARGQWYKPDFFLPATSTERTIAYEVKGPHVFRGGFENLKTAARVHLWITFYLVWVGDDDTWQQQEVLA